MAGPKTKSRWKYLESVLATRGPLTDEDWTPSRLEEAKVLYVSVTPGYNDPYRILTASSGAGGLGCEILKNLALSGFKDIHIIDMDTIDVSNLNRQFLFRQADVGKPKAEIAARFVAKRVPGVAIVPYCGKIQDKDHEYYKQFDVIICGLDSIEARRWINATLVDLVDPDDPTSLKPLVDGGTEGFKGQARVVLPSMTSCIECQLDMHAQRPQVPLCTLATIPRQPQHCIEWAHQIAWSAERKDDTLDTDDPVHITWLYEKAQARAAEFSIEGVTYSMTQGVVKNIIPAIASTNAIVAASCCNEAFKIITGANPFLGFPETNNYMMYTGDDSVYTYTFEHKKKDDCPVCGLIARDLVVDEKWTLQELLDSLAQRPEAIKNASVRSGETSLFYPVPLDLYEKTRPNLKRKLAELLVDGEEVAISDPSYQTQFKFRLSFRNSKG